jgi:hypothetical protein
MSTHDHDSHGHATTGAHEMTDFEGTYAIWAVPFSILVLMSFVLIIALWVPAAVSRELKAKDVAGAESSRAPLLDHRAEQSQQLAAASDRIAVEQAMAAVVRERAVP